MTSHAYLQAYLEDHLAKRKQTQVHAIIYNARSELII